MLTAASARLMMRTSHFREEFESVTKPHGSIRGRLFSSFCRIALSEVSTTVYRICWISVHAKNRRKGHASMAMEWLCELADAWEVTLLLSPLGDPADNAMSTSQLRKWYERCGFKVIDSDGEMRRLPR